MADFTFSMVTNSAALEQVFEGPDGQQTLGDLFAGRSQLIIKHFMMGPGWKEGCLGCSFGADQIDSALVHLINHDVMFVAVSRATYPEIATFHKRMGWHFKWVSSFGRTAADRGQS